MRGGPGYGSGTSALPARDGGQVRSGGISHARYAWTLAAAWTGIVISLLLLHTHGYRSVTLTLARSEALAHLNREQAARLWAASHGGVYVPVDEITPPSPYLAHIPERDLVTPSGTRLTLMDPAYMIRQMSEVYSRLYGVAGRVTSLFPIRPENTPDEWEKKALLAFQQGAEEVNEIVQINGEPYYRLMRPMRAEAACLACHMGQNYQVGGIVGGINVAVPLSTLLEHERDEIVTESTTYGLIWILGIAGIQFGSRRLARHDKERRTAEEQTRLHSRQQIILNSLLRIGLINIPLDKKLELALEEILATPWLPLLSKGGIFLVEKEPNVLVLKVHKHLPTALLRTCARVRFGWCLCGRAAAKRHIVSASRVDDRHDTTYEGMMPHGHYNVPILSEGKVLGVIVLYLTEGHEGTPSEEEFLISVANTLAGIVEREKAEQALRQSEERYALAAQGANDGLWDWDLKRGAIYFSARWKAILGEREDEIGDNPQEWFQRVHPADLGSLDRALKAHWAGEAAHFEHEYRILHKDGGYRWVLSRGLVVRDEDGNPSRMAGSMTDITDRRLTEEQALYDALHDPLTGLPNRVLLLDRLRHAMERFSRYTQPGFAVLFLDLDRFKNVNDSLGHLMGDRLLLEAGRRLVACVRAPDTVARLGGDEFVVLLEEIGEVNDVIRLVERIQQDLSAPIRLGEHEVFTSASIGIVLGGGHYEQPEELLRDADTAMYRVKARGKAGYEVFDSAMHAHALSVLGLEKDLRHAVERQEFCVHYQPIVNLKDGRIAGFEALLRWRHPVRGLLSPLQFLEVAEETGLIIPIGQQLLHDVCRQLAYWRRDIPAAANLWISVNLSSKQIAVRQDLVGMVRRALDEHHLDGACLRLEITESVMMEDMEAAVALLGQLHALGVQLSVDDFGTGYSSLRYLHRFPLQTLKIDRSFIHGEGSGLANSGITGTVVALAHALKLNVVAEGVETSEQLDRLRGLGCEYVQGYLFSRPLEAGAAAELLAARPRW